jgi:hypothetical protein
MPYDIDAYKFTCPGCNSTTSDVARGYREIGKCPNCGLDVAVLREIWRARESHANDELKARFEEMAARAGVAEAKAAKLERRLERPGRSERRVRP